jgi:diguanylate cyclase (GGDEF)-like protein
MQEWLGRLSRGALFGGAAAVLLVITGLSYVGGAALGLPILYVLPVAAVAWFGGRRPGLVTAGLAALFWLGLDRIPRAGAGDGLVVWNALIRAGGLGALAHFLADAAAELRYARTDYLTGIANSRAFYDAVQLESRRAQRYGGAFSLLYLGVDDLRAVNDRFGHPVGDALLRSVALTLRTRMRSTDVVARLGADHFAILLPETDAEAAQGVLRKLEAMLTAISEKGPWSSGFSVGAASFMVPPESVESAMNRAQDLMYAARRTPSGSGRVRCLAESLPPDAPASVAEQGR